MLIKMKEQEIHAKQKDILYLEENIRQKQKSIQLLEQGVG
jgi:hypothetical protein